MKRRREIAQSGPGLVVSQDGDFLGEVLAGRFKACEELRGDSIPPQKVWGRGDESKSQIFEHKN